MGASPRTIFGRSPCLASAFTQTTRVTRILQQLCKAGRVSLVLPTENLGVRRQVQKGQPFRRHGALIDFKVLPMLVQDCAELFRLMRERLYPRAEFVAGNASTISV